MLGVGVESAWTFVFCALDCMFVSEPDLGGESPELVGSWGEGVPWGNCRNKVNTPSVIRAGAGEQSWVTWFSPVFTLLTSNTNCRSFVVVL